MKKTLMAVLLTFTLGTSAFNANATTHEKVKAATEKLCFRYVTTYVTETDCSGCIVTYKVVTTYLFCIPICSTKTEVSRDCSGSGGNGGTGGGTGTGGN